MAPDYQSILALMNLILIACVGVAMIGFYRILKVLGLVPWEASPSREKAVLLENIELDPASMLPVPRVVGTACMPESKAQTQVLPGMTVTDIVSIQEVKTPDQAATISSCERQLIRVA